MTDTRGGQYTTDMRNRTNGNGTIFKDADNTWGNGALTDRATVGVDAHYGTAVTWDYYKNVHGRTGIRNDGVGAFNSRVHYSTNYANAFWSDSCFCMTYGDGNATTFYPLDSLDVAGHEMSHGVTSNTAGLIYSGESGGLNEATSDIFGSMVEYYANNGNDPGDYKIGEEIYRNGTSALRYMYSPNLDTVSADCWYAASVASTCTTAPASPTTSSTCWPKARIRPAARQPDLRGRQPEEGHRQRRAGRHRSRQGRADLVRGTHAVHDLEHQLRGRPRGHAQCRQQPLRCRFPGIQRRGSGLVGRARELIQARSRSTAGSTTRPFSCVQACSA